MKSLGFSEELHRNDYNECLKCKTPTLLLTTGSLCWSPDKEPYKNGENIEDIKDNKLRTFAEKLSDGIELGEEITIHYCPECEKITSINVNWDMKIMVSEVIQNHNNGRKI